MPSAADSTKDFKITTANEQTSSSTLNPIIMPTLNPILIPTLNQSIAQSLSTSSSFSTSRVPNGPLLIEPGMKNAQNEIEIIENANELGSGSCSSTHLAFHKESNTKLAVKLSDHSRKVDLRFNEEVKILKYIRTQLGKTGINGKVAHKVSSSLVEFKGYDTDKYQNTLVLEFCDTDLQKKLDIEYRINEKEVRKLVKQLVPCLDFLHKIGVVHRDLKPANILLKQNNSKSNSRNQREINTAKHQQSSRTYKLSDFDLAYCDYRANSGKFRPLEMQDVVGSIEYMSPEIASNLLQENTEIELELDNFYSEKTDIWSFGVLLYQVLTGERPFTNVESDCGEECEDWHYGNSCIDCEESVLEAICYYPVEFPERLWRDISSEAKDLVKRCLDKDSVKRISAEEMLEHPFVSRKISVSGSRSSLSGRGSLCGEGKSSNVSPFERMKIKMNVAAGDSGICVKNKFLLPVKRYQKSASLPCIIGRDPLPTPCLDGAYNPFGLFLPNAVLD